MNVLGADDQGTLPSDSTLPSPAARLLEAYARGERAFLRVDLADADLHGAVLRDCKFFGADFTGANLSGADLTRADLGFAKLTRADLSGAILSEAKMEGADLSAANMTDVVMSRPSSPLPLETPPQAQPAVVSGAQRFCLSCHSLVTKEAAFCQACGHSLAADAPGVSSSSTALQSDRAVQMTTPVSRASTSLATPSVAPRSAAINRPANKASSGSMNGFMLILALIFGAWDFIWKATIVILVVVGGVIIIKGWVASSTLSEHSTCSQFQQADSSAQDKVLQDMLTAHNDHSSLVTARVSVNLYCTIYGGGAHIDGVYTSGHVGGGPDRALHDTTPKPVFVVYSRQI